MTQQGYFPEWVMAGTVLADTNVFARKFDQKQWSHAFGLQLIPAASAEAAAGLVHAARVVVRDAAADRQQLRAHQGRRRAADGRHPARGPEPHAADVPRRALPRAAAGDRARTRIGTIVTLRQPRLLDGHRLRRPRQRRHPLLGSERRRPRRDRQRRQGHVPPRRRRPALPARTNGRPRRSSCSIRTNTVTIYPADAIPPELVPQQVPVPANAPAAKK